MADPAGSEPVRSVQPSRSAHARAASGALTAAHSAAMEAGEDGYVDPATGLYVFTAAYLADRGTCCDSGCRHCPFVVS